MIMNFVAFGILLIPGVLLTKKVFPQKDVETQLLFAAFMTTLAFLSSFIVLELVGIKTTFGSLGLFSTILGFLAWRIFSWVRSF